MSNISFEDVKLGKFFVKDYMVREIIEDLGDNISYYTYLLDSGEPRDELREMCSKHHITRWAEREATSDEVSRMQRREARIWERNRSSIIASELLRSVPEEWLLNEVQLRTPDAPNIFISYSHLDKEYTQRLIHELQTNLLKPWIDDRIDTGTQWPRVIQDNLDTCSIFIVIMTANSYKSVWVHNELSYAQNRKKHILPLLLEGEVWLSLAAIQYVDVRDGKMPGKRFFSRIKKVLVEEARHSDARAGSDVQRRH